MAMKRKRTTMDDSTCSIADNTCSSTSDYSDHNSLASYATAALSAMGLGTLLLLQLDGISRRILAPDRLLAKRRQEYKYTIEQSCEYTSLMIRQHVGGGKKIYDPKLLDSSEVWGKYTSNDSSEMDDIIKEILDKKKKSPVIVTIEQDLSDDVNPNIYYLYLAFPPPSSNTPDDTDDVSTPELPKIYRRVRLPLLVFCDKLEKAFKDQMTSTALCFVVDASSGMGSDMLCSVVDASDHGVATISNPAWMAFLSNIIVQNKKINAISNEQFEKIIFALCRLDAWRVRSSLGKSKTVLFALPGQACTPLLLPLIQKVFVHERHVFVYDGCCHSVELGMSLRKQYGASYRQQSSNEIWPEVSSAPKVITSTYPMSPLRYNRELPKTLANLNGIQASIVEAWMASVDIFLDMKSKEKKNFYTPFVCRMGFLMKRSGIGNGNGDDMSGLALKNVLEYVTGSKSRALPKDVMDRANACMNEMRTNFEDDVKGCELSAEEKILIEKCVFTHKSILIGEKTLLDTVQPKEDWSLKAAKKLKSCMCCIPGEGDEDEEDEDEDGETEDGGNKSDGGMDLSVPGAFATNNTRTGYVDGKSGFAFDPTRFNK